MDRYNRAYRDPKSPLTPLKPLSSSSAFNFNISGDNSLKNAISAAHPLQHQQLSAKPVKYSEGFAKIRSVFEKPHIKVIGHHKDFDSQMESALQVCATPKSDLLDVRKNNNVIMTNSTHQQPQMRRINCNHDFNITPKIALTVSKSSPLELHADMVSNSAEKHLKTKRVNCHQECNSTPKNALDPRKKEKPIYIPLKSNLLEVQNVNSAVTYSVQTKHINFIQKTEIVQITKQNSTKKSTRTFLKASPINTKALSPRVAKLLVKTGLTKYKPLFQREEIDMSVFKMLTPVELDTLGIKNTDDRNMIFKAIQSARKAFKF